MLVTKDVIDLIKRYRTTTASGTPSTVFGIPILASPPDPVADVCLPYFLINDLERIYLMFPDGTDKGLCIPLSYL
jgi:hypothetical protein